MFRKVSKIAFGSLFLVGGLSGCIVISEFNSSMQPEIRKISPETVSQNNQNSISLSNLERTVYEQVNEFRKSKNLPPLKLNPTIVQQAREHSQAMASGKVPFSHQGFQERVNAIGNAVDYTSAAENVAYNEGYENPAQEAVQGWLKSPGHLKNIVGNFNLTGVGVARNSKGEYYFTQIFINSR